MQRPASRRYPWYDSWWLSKFAGAREILAASGEDAVARFDAAFTPLHTPPGFRTRFFDRVLDDAAFEEALRIVRTLRPLQLELHEARNFGRFVVHGHPFFTELQAQLVPLVSEAVGEAVEPKYNFLSLYTAKGVCPVHLDAPGAKWTLDLCLAQTTTWPIYFSQVTPWPTARLRDELGDDWERAIIHSSGLRFERYALEPRQAVIFSGSSQWHYRNPFPAATGFCHLLFFHYVPRGTSALIDPGTWPELFGAPQLAAVND